MSSNLKMFKEVRTNIVRFFSDVSPSPMYALCLSSYDTSNTSMWDDFAELSVQQSI
ncbi:hypothetical protein M569_10232 [Genlisea aurea]|uniref:Uncharacterized protein n=1 Tax=Genlisea aurea TaxID=192259 RepID=S8CC70_9LAMI|nr:hypothetical protein M569_10232 [Genlisea aurea]